MQDLSIRGENIQRIYDYYINGNLLVNRKYQRKLVWSVEEKKAFIDSIMQGFPIPLILLAEVEYQSLNIFEIIDGMQRLNAIMSFIEGEFDVNGGYFDLETMAKSKQLLDNGELIQKTPKLDRSVCTQIASYILPLSVYRSEKIEKIDEIFRRINSNGRYLSKQDLRQAGSVGNFAQLVRRVSCKVRGDSSGTDQLLLNKMKEISITSKDLDYGINVDRVFWVAQGILTREYVRQSRDEELVADILAYMALNIKPPSSSEILDEYYGIEGESNSRFQEIEVAVLKISPEILNKQFFIVFDEWNKIFKYAGKPFNRLLFSDAGPRLPRYFQILFLALYELLVVKNKVVADYDQLVRLLDNIGTQNMSLGGGGGRWSAKERQKNIAAVTGIIDQAFKPKKQNDPAVDSWITQFENILMQSHIEQAQYDFKQGFHRLDNIGDFDETMFLKVIKTLTSMANLGPGIAGYVIIGIADNEQVANKIKELYGFEHSKYNKFFITGIQGEASKHKNELDGYFQFIIQMVAKAPITDADKNQITRNIRLINYYDKSVIIFRIEGSKEPSLFDGKYYIRKGSNTCLIEPTEYPDLFKRFLK